GCHPTDAANQCSSFPDGAKDQAVVHPSQSITGQLKDWRSIVQPARCALLRAIRVATIYVTLHFLAREQRSSRELLNRLGVRITGVALNCGTAATCGIAKTSYSNV